MTNYKLVIIECKRHIILNIKIFELLPLWLRVVNSKSDEIYISELFNDEKIFRLSFQNFSFLINNKY